MPRVACLLVPDLPLAAVLRAEPELAGRPLGVVEGRRGRGETIIAGWLRGLTVAQAEAAQADLVVRPLSLEGMRSTQEALLDVAHSISPSVEDTAPGRVLIDLQGTQALFPTERGLLTAVHARAQNVGVRTLQTGIGPTRTVAELAAQDRGGDRIVHPEELEDFLSPLPLDLLDPPEEVLERLTRWSVYTLGELTRLPLQSLGTRLGEAGVRLARRAHGEDLTPFHPSPPLLRFEEPCESEYAIHNLEALAFLMRGPLDRLSRRLRTRGLAARALRVELELENHQRIERDIGLGAPTLDAAVFGSLLRLSFEKEPPPEPVERIRIIATPGSLETAQLDLFMPPLPAPAELAVTVARLEALCGSGQVGAPGCQDTHRLDQAHLEEFSTEHESKVSDGDAPSLGPTLALRAFRPPRSVRVWQNGDLPERVAFHSQPLRVLNRAGPWRLFGEWWGSGCFARDYFDVELSDGGVYRLYRNLHDESWFADGMYD